MLALGGPLHICIFAHQPVPNQPCSLPLHELSRAFGIQASLHQGLPGRGRGIVRARPDSYD